MKASNILLHSLFLALCAGQGLIIPDDSPNGLSLHFTDENGNTTSYHESEIPADLLQAMNPSGLNSTSDALISSNHVPIEARRNGDGVVCDNKATVNNDDLRDAVQGFQAWFGCDGQHLYQSLYSYVSATYTWNNVVLFGCDYGAQQTYRGSQLISDMNDIMNQCGAGHTGWWDHKSWKASYGLTTKGSPFCGFKNPF